MQIKGKKITAMVAGLVGVLVLLLIGCAAPNESAKQQFTRRNQTLARNAVELYQVSIDHWVEMESRQGFGKIMSTAAMWRRNAGQISDPARQQEARRFLSEVIEEASGRYINALTRMHEIRSQMKEGDTLFYCRTNGGSYGALYLVRSGNIIEEYGVAWPWDDFQREAFWEKLSQRKPN